MPQMAPLSWTWLYIMFTILFIIIIINNYYLFLYMPKQNLMNKMPMIHKNWKW